MICLTTQRQECTEYKEQSAKSWGRVLIIFHLTRCCNLQQHTGKFAPISEEKKSNDIQFFFGIYFHFGKWQQQFVRMQHYWMSLQEIDCNPSSIRGKWSLFSKGTSILEKKKSFLLILSTASTVKCHVRGHFNRLWPVVWAVDSASWQT